MAMAKQKLYKNQNIFLEKQSSMFDQSSDAPIKPMIVTEANGSSAYVSHVDNPKEQYVIDQRTLKVKQSMMTGTSYRVWLSEEQYNAHKNYMTKREEILKKISEKTNKSSNEELKRMLDV